MPENALSHDEVLDNFMLYWLPNTGTYAARLYWESFHGAFGATELDLPTGYSIFPKDIYRALKSWADRSMRQLIY